MSHFYKGLNPVLIHALSIVRGFSLRPRFLSNAFVKIVKYVKYNVNYTPFLQAAALRLSVQKKNLPAVRAMKTRIANCSYFKMHVL
jgi:hypothetical protein